MITLITACAGGIGAVARFLVDAAVQQHRRWRFPAGTALVNAAGSLLLGLLYGWAQHGGSPEALAVFGTGFCGGFTTFSTASVEVVRLRAAERPIAALTYAGGTLGCCLMLAYLGLYLGRAL